MLPLCHILLLVTVVSFVQASVELQKGVNRTVIFKGDELLIEFKNPKGVKAFVEICLGAKADSVSTYCPQGYTQMIAYVNGEKQKTFKINREGQFIQPENSPKSIDNILFGPDGSLNVLLVNFPTTMTARLPNAKISVIMTTTMASDKETWDKVIIGSLSAVVILLLLLLIVGAVLFYCCWYKKQRQHRVPVTAQEEEARNVQEPLIPSKIVIESQALPPPPSNRPAPLPSATTTTTKRTSTSTTTTKPSDEKPQVAVPPKPASIIPPMPSECVSLTSASTQASSVPVATPKKKSRKSRKSRKSKKSRRRAKSPKMAPAKKPVESPSLPVDKTQSPTATSTQPTPEFEDNPIANAQAAASQYKKREYLRRSEAPLPLSSRSRSRSRSRPIIDEVEDYKLQTESILCFLQRIERLDGHYHFMITERLNLNRPHVITDAERDLLKAAPEDAPALADAVVNEAEMGMAQFLEGHELGWTEEKALWIHLNNYMTPTSDTYIVIYKLMPSLFKLETLSMADPLVRKMPLSMLYCLLLDRKLPKAFRVQLAAEIRHRASKILPRVQKDQMKEVAFPTNYLMLIYTKNQDLFIEGKAVHSKKK